jgi:hypothetical protein
LETSTLIEFKEEINSQELLISFEGEITEAEVSNILQSVESRLESEDENPKKLRKVYNILVEALQNLYHHTDKYQDKSLGNGNKVKSVAFYLSRHDDEYFILAANYISTENIASLKAKLDKINSLDKDGLRDYYKEVLDNGQYSVHGGGGLGIIDIARKSGNKLEYSFQEVTTEFGVFVLKIKV